MELSKRIRRALIDVALRRQRPGTGSERKFLTKRTTSVIWPNLTAILKPTPWAVVGAVATRLYMPERMTQDSEINLYFSIEEIANRLSQTPRPIKCKVLKITRCLEPFSKDVHFSLHFSWESMFKPVKF